MHRYFLVLFIALIGLASCNEKDAKTAGDSSLQAKIDGILFEPEFSTGVLTNIAVATISISGNDANGKQISLLVPEDAPVGTLSLDKLSGTMIGYTASYQVDNSSDNGGLAVWGFITIAAHDRDTNHIKGSFSFETAPFVVLDGDPAPTYSITEGAFDVTYLDADTDF
ncbi:hypothetical protein [Maribacter sp. 2-571]|uniref:hypothetical protein n=1 Tax=Maribacter sp. 2-571 TaxID=3417569 RepID=UPI003D34A184